MSIIRKRYNGSLFCLPTVLLQIKSDHLAAAIHSEMEDYFSEECIRLFTCFIRQSFVKHDEQDLPLDHNAPIQEYIDGYGVRTIQHQGVKVDPVYELFQLDKQG